MPSNTPRPDQGKPTAISVSAATQLDDSVRRLVNRLDELLISCRDLAEYHPDVSELATIERHAEAALNAMIDAKSPVRRLWNAASEAAISEGRS